MGESLLHKNLISGFQLEDYPRGNNPSLIYAHNTAPHLRQVKRHIGGRTYPRESFFRWDKSWDITNEKKTKFLHGRTLADATETYIRTPHVNRAARYVRRNTVRQLNRHPIQGSWFIPDIRIYNRSKHPEFRKAWLVTKKIDENSRFATVVTHKGKLSKIRKELKYERVRPVMIQDYPGRKHSLYKYISSNS